MLNQKRIDSFNKLMHPVFRPELEQLLRRGSINYPLVVDLDPISRCNSACRHCIDAANLKGGYFSREEIHKILTELAFMGCRAVVIVGGGEPLLYPHFQYLLELAVKLKLQLGLVTNGLRLGTQLEAVAPTCSWVRVSVDAARPKTYEFLHHPREGNLRLVLDNMRSLAAVKSGDLGFSFIINRFNVGEISEAARLAAEVGCDFFELKTLINPKNKGVIDLPPDCLTLFNEQLAEVESSRLPLDIVAANSLRYLTDGEKSTTAAALCYAKKIRMVITPHGVYPCANLRGNSRWYLGDARRENLAFIWRRDNSLAIKPAETCTGYCARREFNIDMECLAAGEEKGASLLRYLRHTPLRTGEGDEYLI